MAQQKKSTIGNKKADSDWKFRSGIKIKDYLLYRIQIDLHIVIEPTKMASKDFFLIDILRNVLTTLLLFRQLVFIKNL